ncbi:MAG: hydrogenase nickel incorporation protein HypB [Phycisphaerales bacterium]|jgi:hydrogenase nickel incorporation protein HypB|nr:hydrogenase nickel incorporation protein HypB [Phycisphaerales bacterium]
MSVRVPVVEAITKANDELARLNRAKLDARGILGLNIMASPGAGKTSIIECIVPRLSRDLRVGVIEGDIATSFDAERAAAAGATAVQINTGGSCHLEAQMVSQALDQLPLDALDLLIIENVGNLICPATFALGTHLNILVASVPEGDDKPYKHPRMYRGVQVLIINKIDLLPYVRFDLDRFRRGVSALNEGVRTFEVSCTSGAGIDSLVDWVRSEAVARRASTARVEVRP